MSKAPPSKEAVVVIWDLGKHMKELSKGDSKVVEEGRAAIAEYLLKKIQYSHQDEVGVVLAGTADTHNPLAVQYPGEYQNITVLTPIGKPSPEDIRKLKGVKCDGGKMDMIDSLVVAGDLLNARVKKLRFRKRVFLFTSAGDDVNKKEDLEAVVQSFQLNEISLIIVGVDFTYLTPEQAAQEEDWADLTSKQQNEKVLHHMVGTIGHDSIITPLETALRRLTDLSARSVSQRTATRACLEFGEDLKIPLFAYMKTNKFKLATLRKISKKADEDSAGKVNLERRYFRSDDTDIEVLEDDRVKAYRYGCTVVPFNEVDSQVLKFDGGLKGMKVLAFVPKTSIRRHHLMHGSCVLTTPCADTDAESAFLPFVQALYETDMGAVLRVVKRNYTEPTLCVAWPHITSGKRCLMMNELPYCEDLRKYDFKNQANETLTAEQLRSAEAVINTMDLCDAGMDEDTQEPCEALRPRDVYNPTVQYFQQAVRARLLKPDAALPPVDSKIAKSCCLFASENNNLAGFFRGAVPHIENLKNVMSVKLVDRVEGKGTEGKKYWFADGRGPVDIDAPPAKKPKLGVTDDGSNTTGASYWNATNTNDNKSTFEKTLDVDRVLDKTVVSTITTVTPVSDFKAMITRVDGDFVQQAITEMQNVITKLLQDSIRSQLYNKAKECIQALREACVCEDEAEAFNTYLSSVKKLCVSGQKQKFWTLLQTLNITLITTHEAPDSKVTKQEAEMFLKAMEEEEELPIQPSVEAELDDDLFGALD
eukprot:TRINITY_DN3609_c0_g1_i1.p1 TRINITY_DN3609_c0_g1~~TRINITY_DN3609_c0_g1_i1.p1  ORF type:complete len:761 (+),score=166.13 TRINITY_DN3609_c0_g1_i1:73-2355(+)